MNAGSNKYGPARNCRNSFSLHQTFSCDYPYDHLFKNTKKLSHTCAEREEFLHFCGTIFIHANVHWQFWITVTCFLEHWIGCVGFSSFLAEIEVFWKYWAYDIIKKTWIIPHKAAFLNSFDAFKIVSPYVSGKSEWLAFLNQLFSVKEHQKEKKKPQFRTSKTE